MPTIFVWVGWYPAVASRMAVVIVPSTVFHTRTSSMLTFAALFVANLM